LTVVAGGIPSPTNAWLCSADSGVTWMIITNVNASGTNSPNLVVNNFPPTKWPAGATNFEVIVGNGMGNIVTSTKTIVKMLPTIPNYNLGKWTMNFAIVTTNGGTGTAYTGRGVLGATYANGNYYWNALNPYSGQVINVTANRDDGVATNSGITFRSQAGINVGNGSSLSLRPTNNVLLDTYAQVFGSSTNPTPFVFSNIPNGKYNLALYGCVGNWLDRAIQFTVLTNGVVAGTAAMTNLQDTVFMPNDNTAVFTNLIVNNQRLEVDINFLPCPLHTNTVSGEAEFNGAQLEMLTYGLNIGVMSNQFLAWTGGGLYTATNVTGPWVTNPGVSPLLLTNRTEAKRFYKVFSPTPPF
jgi:hypothetical protein